MSTTSIRRLFAACLLFSIACLAPPEAMATTKVYIKDCPTGGGSCLDGIDGNDLADGDRALIDYGGESYRFLLDADSGAAETTPPDYGVIAPDANPGTKRWIQQTPAGASVTMATSTTDETTFGLSNVTGTSSNAARQDHRHGSPTNPVTGHESTYTHSNIATNTTHRTSTGADHTYINQSVTTSATPAFAGASLTGDLDVKGNQIKSSTQSAVELGSTTSAPAMPTLTTPQRDALAPVNGMFIYNSTTGNIERYEDAAWSAFSAGVNLADLGDTNVTVPSGGNLLVYDSPYWVNRAVAGDVSIDSGGITTIGANKITEAMLKAVNSPTDEYCLSYELTTGDFEWQICGGTTTPGGSDTYVQFKDGTAFGGDAGFTYNKTTDTATLVGGLTIDTINERTAAAGVTIDGALIKDGDLMASYWVGKSILWAGTSIPYWPDAGSTSYPAQTAAKLGATVTNVAYWGSHMFYDPDDTRSCASNASTAYTLSARTAELQTEIDAATGADDAYCTTEGVTRMDCDTACDPPHGPAHTDAFILGQSYESKLIGQGADLLIFNHDHNDRLTVSGATSFGTLDETWVTISAISTGATTTLTAAGHGLTTGDSFSVRTSDKDRDNNGVTVINSWTGYVADSCGAIANCATVSGNDIVLNYASTGTFDSGDENAVAEYNKFYFYDAMNYVIRAVYFDNPDILLAFVTSPTFYTAATNDPDFMDDVRGAIFEVARKYGAPVYDTMSSLSINNLNLTTWQADRYHPDEAARLLIASHLAGWLASGVPNTNQNTISGPTSSTDNAIVRFDGTTGKIVQGYTSAPPTITDTGLVRIGALPTNLGSSLDVYKTIGLLDDTTGANFQFRTVSNNLNYGSWITGYSAGGSLVSPTYLTSGHEILALRGYGYNGTYWWQNQAARIVFKAAEDFTDSSHSGGEIIFETTGVASGADADPRMAISADGSILWPNISSNKGKIDGTDGALSAKAEEVIKTASATLTVLEMSGTSITNYGETDDADLILTGSDADTYPGLNFTYTIAAAMSTNDTCFKAAADNKINLAGTDGADNGCVCNTTPTKGDKLSCYTTTIGASVADWFCEANRGTWALVADATGDCPN